MPNNDIKNSLKDADYAKASGDMGDGDWDRGYYDAAPEGNYEGSLGNDMSYSFANGEYTEAKKGSLDPGMIERNGFERTHGNQDEHGFVRRPLGRGDVERT